MSENKTPWSLSRIMGRFHHDNRGIGFLAQPIILALILDVVLILGLGFGLGWSHVIGGALYLRLSIFVMVISLPLVIAAPHPYVKLSTGLLFVLALLANLLTVY